MDDGKVAIEVDGIPVLFDTDALDDFDNLELFARLQDEDLTAMPLLAVEVFGAEQFEEIKRTMRSDDPNGRCRTSRIVPFINACIVEAARVSKADAKN